MKKIIFAFVFLTVLASYGGDAPEIIPTTPFSAPGIRTCDFEGAYGYSTTHDSPTVVIAGNLGSMNRAVLSLSYTYYSDLYQYCVEHENPLCSGNTYNGATGTQAVLLQGVMNRWLNVWCGGCYLLSLPKTQKGIAISSYAPWSYVNPELKKYDSTQPHTYELRTDKIFSHPVVGIIPSFANGCNRHPYYVPFKSQPTYSVTGEVLDYTPVKAGNMYGIRPTPVDVDGTEYGLLPVKTCRDDAVLYCCLNNLFNSFPAKPTWAFKEQFDWFVINDSSEYEYVKFTTTKLDDSYDIGSVYVFTDESIAQTCTNFSMVASNADVCCSLKNAQNGFDFATRGKDNVMICVAQPDFQWAIKKYEYTGYYGVHYDRGFMENVTIEETDSPQKYCRITKYRFKLSAGSKPTDPSGTEVFSPLIYTNTYLVTSSDILVYEDDPVTISITPKSTNPSDVMFHFVENDTEVSHVTIPANSSEKVSVEYAPKFDPDFNEDHYRTLHVKNYSMDASMNIMVRDIMVEYAATERRYYDDDGVRFFPETGNWFVDRDYLLRSENPSADDVSVVLNFTHSGQMKITAEDAFQVREAESFAERNVIQTNYIKNASEKHVRHIDTLKAKIPSSFKSGTASGTSYDVSVTSNTVLRISTKNGNKFSVLRLE